MHDKSLKHFRISIRDLHPNINGLISIKRPQYPPNVQRATRSVLDKVELFDK